MYNCCIALMLFVVLDSTMDNITAIKILSWILTYPLHSWPSLLLTQQNLLWKWCKASSVEWGGNATFAAVHIVQEKNKRSSEFWGKYLLLPQRLLVLWYTVAILSSFCHFFLQFSYLLLITSLKTHILFALHCIQTFLGETVSLFYWFLSVWIMLFFNFFLFLYNSEKCVLYQFYQLASELFLKKPLITVLIPTGAIWHVISYGVPGQLSDGNNCIQKQ